MNKLAITTGLALLLSTGYAFAEPMTSGRPSAVLNDTQCQSVWSRTERDGDTLSEGKAKPFIVNFKMVDANGDGKISWDEKQAARKVWYLTRPPPNK